MKAARRESASSDSSTSTESSTSSSAVRSTGATYTTKEVKQKLTATAKPETPAVRTRPVTETPTATATTTSSPSTVPEKKPFQSRFLPNHQQEKKEETESSSEEETSSEESEEEEEKPPAKTSAKDSALKTDIGPLLTRANNARESQADSTRRASKDESSSRGGYSSPTSYSRGYERESSPKYTRTRPTRDQYDEPKYGSSTTGTSG